MWLYGSVDCFLCWCDIKLHKTSVSYMRPVGSNIFNWCFYKRKTPMAVGGTSAGQDLLDLLDSWIYMFLIVSNLVPNDPFGYLRHVSWPRICPISSNLAFLLFIRYVKS